MKHVCPTAYSSEGSIKSSRTGDKGSYEPPCGCWEGILGPRQHQQILPTIKPSLLDISLPNLSWNLPGYDTELITPSLHFQMWHRHIFSRFKTAGAWHQNVHMDFLQIHQSLLTITNFITNHYQFHYQALSIDRQAPRHKGFLWDQMRSDTIPPRCWMLQDPPLSLSRTLQLTAQGSAAPALEGQRASVNIYTTPSWHCPLQTAKHWLQKLRAALSEKEQKCLWVPSTDSSDFCIAPVHSQQMGHYLRREAKTSLA